MLSIKRVRKLLNIKGWIKVMRYGLELLWWNILEWLFYWYFYALLVIAEALHRLNNKHNKHNTHYR